MLTVFLPVHYRLVEAYHAMRLLTHPSIIRALLGFVVIFSTTLILGCGLSEYDNRMDQRRSELRNDSAPEPDSQDADVDPEDDA